MAAPAPAPPPHPAVLIDDLIEQFLLRLPPEDPAVLARAALVSRQWHRVITGAVFRRRFREFHRSPPLLGYIVNLRNSIRFVPVSSFRPRRHADRPDVRVVHSSHGRVLLRRSARNRNLLDVLLSVWDPITDKEWDLPSLPLSLTPLTYSPGSGGASFWDAAVVCAVGDGCNHLHCHFKVVFVGISQGRNFSCVYSSEAQSWCDPTFTSSSGESYLWFETGACVLAGSALYFKCAIINAISKYDLLTHQMSRTTLQHGNSGVLIAAEDGSVGVAKTINSKLVILSSREHGRWAESRVIELPPLHDFEGLGTNHWVVGFAETGAGVIFLKTHVGYFTIDLNSGKSKKVGETIDSIGDDIVPYVSFCTPALGAISIDEGPRPDVAVPTDD